LNRNKNQKTIIQALTKLNQQNVYFVICGIGSMREYLENMAKESNVLQNVIFAGYMENIAEILKASDAFVFSSLREGLPVALMEAMAAALPCVVSRIRGNVDLLEQTGGYLVGPDDADGFADAIRNLINGKDLRDLMGEKNKDAIVKYDVKNVVKILKDIYDGLT
jgi:glycosyltransferase involved in cell wall biosynthesis